MDKLPFIIVRNLNDVQTLEAEAERIINNVCTKFNGMSYEEGIRDVLHWLQYPTEEGEPDLLQELQEA